MKNFYILTGKISMCIALLSFPPYANSQGHSPIEIRHSPTNIKELTKIDPAPSTVCPIRVSYKTSDNTVTQKQSGNRNHELSQSLNAEEIELKCKSINTLHKS